MAMDENLQYQIALKKLNGVGPHKAKKLVSYAGGVKELFESTEKENGWDGTYKGNPVDNGVYVYSFIIEDINFRRKRYSGEIHLVRQ